MKKIFFTWFILSIVIQAQEIGYVEVQNNVYRFLDRMDVLHIIEDYNPLELPKTRKEIAKHLKSIDERRNTLNTVDQEFLEQMLVEFEIEVFGTTNEAMIFFEEDRWNWNKEYFNSEKFVYFSKSENLSLFVNILLSTDFIHSTSTDFSNNPYSLLVNFGGRLRGTAGKHFGFSFEATNGSFFGSKSLAKSTKELAYNPRFVLEERFNTNTDFFDNAEGFLAADFGAVKLKLGNDRTLIGYGREKVILGDYSSNMNFLSTKIRYKNFDFTAIHGGLAHGLSVTNPRSGNTVNIEDKLLAYHRFGINIGESWTIGAGEMAIYSNRSIDFAYLNPFNFYKNAEHTGNGKDNTLLFVDFSNRSIPGLKFFAQLMFDDLRFGKLGTSWFGNQSLLNAVVYASPFMNSLPLDFELQFIRVDPYFYAHRSIANNYANGEFPLGSIIPPNSYYFNFAVHYRFSGVLNSTIELTYTKHADNLYDGNGEIITNHGGDLWFDRSLEDSFQAPFMEGIIENRFSAAFEINYEYINNFYVNLIVKYINDEDVIKNEDEIRSKLIFQFRI